MKVTHLYRCSNIMISAPHLVHKIFHSIANSISTTATPEQVFICYLYNNTPVSDQRRGPIVFDFFPSREVK